MASCEVQGESYIMKLFYVSYFSLFWMSLKSQKKGKDEVRGNIAAFKRKITDIQRRHRHVCMYIHVCIYCTYTHNIRLLYCT